MAKIAPAQEAALYLQSQWQHLGKRGTPPLELTRAVCQVANLTGYKRKVVSDLLRSYLENQGEEVDI